MGRIKKEFIEPPRWIDEEQVWVARCPYCGEYNIFSPRMEEALDRCPHLADFGMEQGAPVVVFRCEEEGDD